MLKIISFGKTDCGLRRSNNEDAFLVKPEFGFCLVADGMGGAAAGELASQIFSETALDVFSTAERSTFRSRPSGPTEFYIGKRTDFKTYR